MTSPELYSKLKNYLVVWSGNVVWAHSPETAYDFLLEKRKISGQRKQWVEYFGKENFRRPTFQEFCKHYKLDVEAL